MSVSVSRKTYPLLKVAVPVAILLAAIGLWLFMTQKDADGASNPMNLVWWVVAAAVVVFGSLLVRRHETVEMRLPSDELEERSRTELEGLLATLDQQKARGELSPERHRKARAKIEAQLKAKNKR
ncbi:MAG: hypothetical protein QOD77_1481 [Thermoplasmata archaeon]|jgi:hypothetical protein|nr:hypothetical protein [Thermoplasmata archaeon]